MDQKCVWVHESPDAGHFKKNDEDSETKIDVSRSFGGKHGSWNATLAKGGYENALMLHQPIGNRSMKGNNQKTEQQAHQFEDHAGDAIRKRFRASIRGTP